MFHHNKIFSKTPTQEWLIYFKRASKTFSVWVIGKGQEFRFDGNYLYSGNIGVSVQFEAVGESISLALKADKEAPLKQRLFGSAPLLGAIFSASKDIGSCFVENNHAEGRPTIRVETRNPPCRLEAYRSSTDLVICPLRVFGIKNCEMILEDFEMFMFDSVRRKALPHNKLRRHFVGSIRTIYDSPDAVRHDLKEIVLIVTLTHLIAQPSHSGWKRG